MERGRSIIVKICLLVLALRWFWFGDASAQSALQQ